MEANTSFIEQLVEKLEAFGTTRLELIKLKTVDKTAGFISNVVSRFFAWLAIFLFILIANIGLALWLGNLLGKSYYGFFCVAGFYALVGFGLFIAHHAIKKAIGNSMINQLLD